MYQVIPVESQPNQLDFWLGIWQKDLPTGIQFRLRKGNQNIVTEDLPRDRWSQRGTPPNKRVWYVWRIFQGPLASNTEYFGELWAGGQLRATGVARTLPQNLPDQSAVKPFNVFVGSCYFLGNDPNRLVPDAYMHLWNDTKWRPDIKFLCGDQIYFDNPPTDFTQHIIKQEWIRTRLTNKYRNTWEALNPLLSQGSTYFLTDDHEYYNDYPNRGNAPWVFKLSAYDDYLENKTEEFAATFQASFRRKIEIGSDLEFMILDTRRFRSLSAGSFAQQVDVDTTIQWLKNLETPGVLVLSSPIFVHKTERSNFNFGVTTGTVITDHNLPYFESQFKDLAHALLEAKVDIVVVAGDPHFSRVAMCDVMNPRHKIVEVISSAMATVDGAGGNPSNEPNLFPLPGQSHPSIPSSNVRYLNHSSNKPQKQEAADNFVTLSFTSVNKLDRLVEMRIRSWFCKRRDPNLQPPVPVDFEQTIQLKGRPIVIDPHPELHLGP